MMLEVKEMSLLPFAIFFINEDKDVKKPQDTSMKFKKS